MEEVWKSIEGYEGVYEVSNAGKVRSLDRKRKVINSTDFIKGRELKPSFDNGGYLKVNLSKNGNKNSFMIHRLVAKAFVENKNPSKNIAVNHKDGDKTNNCFLNLEWVTYSENQKHAYRNGLNRWNPRKGKPMKSVVQLDVKTNQIISIHESVGDATRSLNAKSSSGISRCCNRKKRYYTAYGFKWMFKEDYEKSLESEE